MILIPSNSSGGAFNLINKYLSRLSSLVLKTKNKKTMKLMPFEKKIVEKAKKKNLLPTVEAINRIGIGGSGGISLTYKPLKADMLTSQFPIEMLNSREKGLPFKITLEEHPNVGGVLYKESYGLNKSLTLQIGEAAYYIKEDSVLNFKTQFPSNPQLLEGKFKNLSTFKDLRDPFFSRMVIHTDDTEITYPSEIIEFGDNHMIFDQESFNRQKTTIGLPMFTTKGMFARLNISGISLDFYAVEQLNTFFLDSCEKINPELFKQTAYAVRLCFALLTGKFYRDEIFCLYADHEDFLDIKHFEYELEPSSILSRNQLVNYIFFFETFSSLPQDEQEKLQGHRRLFSAEVFSRMCQTVLDAPEMTRAVELLVNAGGLEDPVQKGALYSVAVETLTEYMKNENEKAFKPIQDKAVWNDFKDNMLASTKNLTGKADPEGIRIIQTKIDNLNSPTNREKLTKPFELVGITLTDVDQKVLEQRNKYLHGGTPSDTKWKAEQNMEALKLHTLTGILFLKYCGYSGHYINLAAWHIMHLTETNERLEKFDLNKMKDITKTMEEGKIEPDRIAEMQEYLISYQRYLKSILEIHEVIKYLD